MSVAEVKLGFWPRKLIRSRQTIYAMIWSVWARNWKYEPGTKTEEVARESIFWSCVLPPLIFGLSRGFHNAKSRFERGIERIGHALELRRFPLLLVEVRTVWEALITILDFANGSKLATGAIQ